MAHPSFTQSLLSAASRVGSGHAVEPRDPKEAIVSLLVHVALRASTQANQDFHPEQMTDEECAWLATFLYIVGATLVVGLSAEGDAIDLDEVVYSAAAPILISREPSSRAEVIHLGRRFSAAMIESLGESQILDKWVRAVHLGAHALVVADSKSAVSQLATLYDVLFRTIRKAPALH